MIKHICIVALLAVSVQAQQLQKIGDLLMVTPDGKIVPEESAASIYDIATLSAQAVANAQAGALASQAVAQVRSRQDGLEAFVHAQENTMYLDSFNVLTVGPPLQADTNLIARFVAIEPKIRLHTDPAYWVNRLTMSFSSDPGYMPTIRTATNAKETNTWNQATLVAQDYTTRLHGATSYGDAVWSEVLTPVAWTGAVFRAAVDVRGSGTNVQNLTVNNGVSIRGSKPLTRTFIQGTNTLVIKGGTICQE